MSRVPNQEFSQLASAEQLTKTVRALEANGMRTIVVETGDAARACALDMILSGVVVGTQKLVRTLDDGLRRIREYSFHHEDARTRQVYGQPSAINKILLVQGELPGRITIVLVTQNLGF